MNRIIIISTILLCIPLVAMSKAKDMAEMQEMMAELQRSHIEGNVPSAQNFDSYLSRDLKSYFGAKNKEIEVRYELLRNGPTQSGVSYPKYYLWVEVRLGTRVLKQGAARLAAIDKVRFEVFSFLSKAEIQAKPEEAAKLFPRMLLI